MSSCRPGNEEQALRFQQRLDNENAHGKVMGHENFAKSHGIMLSVLEFYQMFPKIFSITVESPHFLTFA